MSSGPGLRVVSRGLLATGRHAVQGQSQSVAALDTVVPTRSLPKHERLVDLHGSVIDYSYGGGSSIAVLLIMERLHRDLYTGLKVRQGRGWGSRRGAGLNRSQQPDPRGPPWPVFLSCLSRPSSFHRTFFGNNQVLLPLFPKNLKSFSESIFWPSLYPEYCQCTAVCLLW